MKMKRLAIFAAIFVLASALLLMFLWPPHRPAIVWLTQAQFAQIMKNPPASKLPRPIAWCLRLLRSLKSLGGRRGPPNFDINIEAFKAAAIRGEVAPAGLPVSTNAAAWQAWIVPATEWKTLHHSITSAPDAVLFRPVILPAPGVAGGSGTVGLADGISRFFFYDLKTKPADNGLNLTLSYRSGEGAKTNVSLAFSATVPVGGAVIIKRSDDARVDATVLSLTVWAMRR
jgi:hypothetical protein